MQLDRYELYHITIINNLRLLCILVCSINILMYMHSILLACYMIRSNRFGIFPTTSFRFRLFRYISTNGFQRNSQVVRFRLLCPTRHLKKQFSTKLLIVKICSLPTQGPTDDNLYVYFMKDEHVSLFMCHCTSYLVFITSLATFYCTSLQ